jgi:hypothetical protein
MSRVSLASPWNQGNAPTPTHTPAEFRVVFFQSVKYMIRRFLQLGAGEMAYRLEYPNFGSFWNKNRIV